MTDLFTHLAAQSLPGSGSSIQPLTAPLFAPAPELAAPTEILASRAMPAFPGDAAPSPLAASWAEAFPEEKVFKEAPLPARRETFPNLVPPDAPRPAVSAWSLRLLLQPQPRVFEENARVLPEVASATVETNEAPPWEEPRVFTASPAGTDQEEHGSARNVEDEPGQAAWKSEPPVPAWTQDDLLADAVAESEETGSLALSNGVQERRERSSPTAPGEADPQSSLARRQPDFARENAGAFQEILPAKDATTIPSATSGLEVQREEFTQEHRDTGPVVPASTPGSRASVEPLMARDDGREQALGPLAQTGEVVEEQARSSVGRERADRATHQSRLRAEAASVRPLLEQTATEQVLMPPVFREALSSEPASPGVTPYALQSGLATPVDQDVRVVESLIEPLAPYETRAEELSRKSKTPDTQEEMPPVHISIGRVVVRTTVKAQAAPAQKRVPRPAQSLDEYLKKRQQRERKSR